MRYDGDIVKGGIVDGTKNTPRPDPPKGQGGYNIEIPPSSPVTKEEREAWLQKAEYGGKTRRLIDHLNQAEAERDALAKLLADFCIDSGFKKWGRGTTPGEWLEWARVEAGKKG